jgi:ABC-type transporter Mla subunit MlaD
MYPQPAGAEPSAEQIRDLDDTYLSSDPTGYFRARIDALLSWAAAPLAPATSELAQDFETILGAVASARRPLTEMDRRLQVAVDALQVRHQAAEALLRLLHARIGHREKPELRSLWLTVIETPTRTEDLVEELRPSVESANFLSVAAGLLLPVPAGTRIDGAHLAGVTNAVHWVCRAAEVLSSGHIDVNAANNKIKHGVTARAEGNLRVTFHDGASRWQRQPEALGLDRAAGPSTSSTRPCWNTSPDLPANPRTATSARS